MSPPPPESRSLKLTGGALLGIAFPISLFLCLATALLAPSYFMHPGALESFKYNYLWITELGDEIARGQLYPRWLSGSFGGLGSPTFYFYPPLAFDLTAYLTAPFGGLITATTRLAAGATLALAASGAAMFAWLRTQTSSRGAMIGAVVYMAMPYHLYDYYVRGAFAEFWVYAVIPLAILGIERVREDQAWGVPILAISFAAAVACHLPTALLLSVTVIPAYAVFRSPSVPGLLKFYGKIAFGLGLGLGLAAVYLVPALTLQRFISPEYLESHHFRVENWFFLNAPSWPDRLTGGTIVSFTLAAAVLGLTLGLMAWRRKVAGQMFWAGVSVGCCLILSGIVPLVWSIPVLDKVQFPWRLLTVVDFASATLVGLTLLKGVRPVPLAVVGAIAAPGIAVTVVFAASLIGASGRLGLMQTRFIESHRQDAVEYLPRGSLVIDGENPMPRVALPRLAALPLVQGEGSSASQLPDGSLIVHHSSPNAATVVLRRNYFPSWRVSRGKTAIPARPYGPSGLLSFSAPAGPADFTVAIAQTPQERVGGTLSLASLAALLAYILTANLPALRRELPGGGRRVAMTVADR